MRTAAPYFIFGKRKYFNKLSTQINRNGESVDKYEKEVV
jgi:hypothetical protein